MALGMRLRRLLGLNALVLAGLALPAATAHAYPLSFGPVAKNPADRLAALPVDAERYDHSRRCTRRPRKGTLALQAWLQRHWRGTSWGIMRCEELSKGNFSLHADGRALDWHLDRSVPADARAARALIETLLAPDAAGTPRALARRLGLQEIIWDCRAWWAGGSGMGPYSVCFDERGRRRRHVSVTSAHRDHIHLGLSFAGAAERTTFWTSGARAR
jgi:hypothetical protein